MSFSSRIRAVSNRAVIRGLALVVLFAMWGRIEPLSNTVLDADIWWHLRGGDAIVAQHTLPHHGVFTQHSERPWVEYSWGFEVIAASTYRHFGLLGLVALRFCLQGIISAALFVIIFRGLGSFWGAWLLAAAGIWAIHHCLGLQPMLTSIVLFTFEMALIFEARRRGTVRPLTVLPLLFLIWANLHIQFVYGLVVLLLLASVSSLRAILPNKWAIQFQPYESRPYKDLPASQLVLLAALSVIATVIGPYTWHLYAVLLDYVRSSVPYAIITELQALSFRYPEHFVLLLVLVAAFFTLGWRRSHDPFKLILLVICTLIGLRMTRDSWLACIPALAIIADRDRFSGEEPAPDRRQYTFAFGASTALATALVFVCIAWDSNLNEASLRRTVAAKFPADACAFIRTHSLPGPLYNDMDWGGYLIWALPDKPVAIDNRTDLYGDDILKRFYSVRAGFRDWRGDPDLESARLVLLDPRPPLANSLLEDEHFKVLYQDQHAVVISHNIAPIAVSRTFNQSITPKANDSASR